jgi:hypothetical protein
MAKVAPTKLRGIDVFVMYSVRCDSCSRTESAVDVALATATAKFNKLGWRRIRAYADSIWCPACVGSYNTV